MRLPRHAEQMDPAQLSPLTTRRGVILNKPRRRDTQCPDEALARASAVLKSPMVETTLTTPVTSPSARQKIHQQMMMEHFANLDIEMVYNMGDDEQDESEERAGVKRVASGDSMDMANIFYSEH